MRITKSFLNKKLGIGLTTAAMLVTVTGAAFAAAPDGQGPWADTVVSFSQGLRKDGTPVLASRSNPSAALGVAEDSVNGVFTEGTFTSLGFGGSLTLGLDNGISSGAIVFESTNTNTAYPSETAKVEVSANGTNWVLAGLVTRTGQVNIPQGISCAKFVRITDTSNKNAFGIDPVADAYDVNGVKAVGQNCQVASPTPTPSPTTPPVSSGCTVAVVQQNTAVVNNNVGAGAGTGNNNASNNTGGNTSVNTGNASTGVSLRNRLNRNSARVINPCQSNVSAVITGNGAGSLNQIIVNQ